jgi:hypothetical protein
MGKKHYLNELIRQGLFRFDHLSIMNIDNEPVARLFSGAVLEQEICLFANPVKSGADYCEFLRHRVLNSMQNRLPLPVARFADGEYAFYGYTLGCNGLYKQAESIDAITKAMPLHIAAMKYLAASGILAPLVHPGNSQTTDGSVLSLRHRKKDSSGLEFLDFLNSAGIALNSTNYLPFYVIYAFLTSPEFGGAMDGKKICILNSEYDEKSCYEWFAQSSSRPRIYYIPIPSEYVATRWEESKREALRAIPPDIDLCLVGAGVGALLICADVARTFSVPAIDAGHVLNMMNGRVDKSNGARLYTLRKGHYT